MSKRDEEYDDEYEDDDIDEEYEDDVVDDDDYEEYEDEYEDLDDDGNRRRRSNSPFSNKPPVSSSRNNPANRSSGFNSPNRPPASSGSSGSSSGFNRPGGTGNLPGSKFGSGGSSGGSGSGGGSGSSFNNPARPAGSSGGGLPPARNPASPFSSDSKKDDAKEIPRTSFNKPDDKKEDSRPGGGSGVFGSKPGENRTTGSYSSTNRPADNKPVGGGGGVFGNKPADKPAENKPSGGGGLFGAKPADKPGEKKDESKPAGGGVFGSRPPEKKEEPKSGGGGVFGSAANKLGGDKKDDSKPGDKKDDKSSGGGGIGGFKPNNPFGKKDDDKKDEKPSGGGGIGGFKPNNPFGKKDDDKKDDKSSGGGGGIGGFKPNNPFAKKDDGDKKDDKSSDGGGLLGSARNIGGSLPFGKKDDAKDGDKKDDKSSGGGIGGFKPNNPFAKKDDSKPGDKKDDKSSGGGGLLGSAKNLGSSVTGGASNLFGGKKDEPKKDDKPASSSSGSSSSGSSFGGNKPAGSSSFGSSGSSSSGSSSSGGGAFGSNKPSTGPLSSDKSGSGSSSSSSGSSTFNKPASGGTFGGGGSSSSGSSSSGGGAFGNKPNTGPLSSDKKDDKPGSSTSSGGGAFGNKPAGSSFGNSSSSSSSSGSSSSGGGAFGSKPSAFGSDKKDDKPATSAVGGAPAAANKFGSSGQVTKTDAKPGTSGSKDAPAKAVGAGGSASALGSKLTGALPKPKLPNFAEKIKGFSLFKKSEKSGKTRTSKAPVVKKDGITLDTKLDVLGVVLVLAALMVGFSSLSTQQGQLTGALNTFLGETFGWGALAIPIFMMAVGVWLIMRHFGDEAPVLAVSRLAGLGVMYISALVLFQYIEAMRYELTPGTTNHIEQLENLWLLLSVAEHRGGGLIGAEIYLLLLSTVSEMGGFFVMLGGLLIGFMFTFSISAAEMAIFFISLGRSFVDANQRRRVRSAALKAERAAMTPLTPAPQIGVSKPLPASLPAGAAAALPAPAAATPAPAVPVPAPAVPVPAPLIAAAAAKMAEPEPEPVLVERRIPITQGGRTATVTFNPGEPSTVVEAPKAPEPIRFNTGVAPTAPAAPAASLTAAPAAVAAPVEVKPADDKNGSKPGVLGRFGIGGNKGSDSTNGDSKPADAAKPEEAKPGIGGAAANVAAGVFGKLRPGAKTGETAQAEPANGSPVPAAPAASIAPAAPAPASSAPKPGGLFSGLGKPKDTGSAPAVSPAAPPAAQPAAQPIPQPAAASTSPASAPAAEVKAVPASPFAPKPVPAETAALSAPNISVVKPAAEVPAASPAAPVRTFEAEEEKPVRLGTLVPPIPANDKPAQPMGDAKPIRTGETAAFKPLNVPPPRATGLNKPVDEPAKPKTEDEETLPADMMKPAQPKSVTGVLPRATGSVPAAAVPASGPPRRDNATDLPVTRPESSVQDRMAALRAAAKGETPADKPADGASEPKPAETAAPAAKVEASGVRPFSPVETPAAVPAAEPAKPAAPDPGKPLPPPWDTPAPAKPAEPVAAPAPVVTEVKPAEPVKPAAGIRPFGETASAEPAKPAVPAAPAAQNTAPAPAAYRMPEVPAPPPPMRAAGITAPSAVPEPPPQAKRVRKEWETPDTSKLLTSGEDQELDHDVLIERARTIEETLASFGAPGRVVEVRTGPVITQFGVEPDYLEARGGKKIRIKVSAIAQLDKDLQLALGARSIRIEAPVPGKGYVGIEVPNEKPSVVRMRDVLESDQFRKIGNSALAFCLGQGVDGTPVAADLTTMPHLLIAGTTGSGKSVCVNAIITSILIRNSPDKVKFIMVDPKRVELTGYNGVPHLVAPVVVELERIVSVLKWVTREMDERYKKFSSAGARNIEDYNKHRPQSETLMPYIVVVIDELADLMMLAPDETERVITRLAAMARATGIHLIIATQRPSVDVVTGLIKANFPARIAFAVAGGVDSRVILDQPGAERLLGRGDMLFMSAESPAPQRLQGVYVSDSEINNIARFWRSQMDETDIANRPLMSSFMNDEGSSGPGVSWNSGKNSGGSGGGLGSSRPGSNQQAFWDREMREGANGAYTNEKDDDDDDDDDDVGEDGEDAMFDESVELVRRLNKASVSLLQRRLRIGYTRAARLIDLMEERGIIGPPTEGSKPRDVLPSK